MGATVYDAVVIGSGAGGAAAALALTQAGVNTLVLEAGPQFDPQRDYEIHQSRWELSDFPSPPGSRGRYTFAPMQPIPAQAEDLRSWNRLWGKRFRKPNRFAYQYSHVRGVGGSTLHYTGEAHRLNPRSMRLASEYGVGADWPLSYAELEPYYVGAERVAGVAGPSQDSRCPRSAPFPMPAHRLSFASQQLAKGCDALQLSWTANSVAAASTAYDGRPPCNYCGQCQRGCNRLDKGSADLTFLAHAMRTGRLELRSRCRVVELLSGPDDRIRGLRFEDPDGELREIRAQLIFVACGAVESPRLLLNSQGVGSSSGPVGKHFIESLYWFSAALSEDAIGSHRGHPSDAICWDFNSPDAIEGVIGGCRFSPAALEGGYGGPIAYAQRVVGGWGREHKRRMREQFGRVLAVSSIGEQLPNAKSFIDLDPKQNDELGYPLARIHSHISAMDMKRLAFMAKTSRSILRASNAPTIFEEQGSADLFNVSHALGGCRMGEDESESVVDSNGRCHRWRNLYLVDASVFPSSGGGESPSLTIHALALRSVAKALATE